MVDLSKIASNISSGTAFKNPFTEQFNAVDNFLDGKLDGNDIDAAFESTLTDAGWVSEEIEDLRDGLVYLHDRITVDFATHITEFCGQLPELLSESGVANNILTMVNNNCDNIKLVYSAVFDGKSRFNALVVLINQFDPELVPTVYNFKAALEQSTYDVFHLKEIAEDNLNAIKRAAVANALAQTLYNSKLTCVRELMTMIGTPDFVNNLYNEI